MHSSLERIAQRVERANSSQGKIDSDASHLDVYLRAALQFEFPTIYTPLIIDTTDESESARKQQIEEVLYFLREGVDKKGLEQIKQKKAG